MTMLLAAAMSAFSPEPVQSSASYEAAIRNTSTAPSYVMVTIVDANTNLEWTTCTTANFLVGALHMENGLAHDAEGTRQATALALLNTEHRFVFFSEAALRNIPAAVSPEELKQVRARFAPVSNEELRAGFGTKPWGALHDAFPDRRYLNAVACVLIERGLSPYMGDRTGAVSVGG
ncbi:MAG TPA: hypothetical protein VFS02_01870 [Telluria sp.]|nr:hypothetical protein [Telluria sp.]